MRRAAITLIASLVIAIPAFAETFGGIAIEREQLLKADANHDGTVTEAEFRAWLKADIERLVATSERHWAIMLKVLDGPDVKRLHVRESARLSERFVERLDADRDGKPSPEELKAYAKLIRLPAELEKELEITAKATLESRAGIGEEEFRKLEEHWATLDEDEAYISSDGGTGSGSDRRWLKPLEEGYVEAFKAMALDGAVHIQ